MKKAFCLLLLVVLGVGCTAEKTSIPVPPRLILFEAAWCPYCKSLNKELEAAGIGAHWLIEANGCTYNLSMTHVSAEEEHPDGKFRKTAFVPEQVLVQGQATVGFQNYKDKKTLHEWLQRTLRQLPCTPQKMGG